MKKMLYKNFESLLGEWGPSFKNFIESEEMDEIYSRLKSDSKEGRIICPASSNTFKAFELCPLSKLKCILIAMDPYPYYINKTYTADGLAFSCSITDKAQPSLRVLYDAIEDDLHKGFHLNHERPNDLTYLAEQGVLLLNSSLTVEANKVGSHTELWKPFMRFLIEEILNPSIDNFTYILMGQKAQYFAPYIMPFNHWVLQVEHPANAARRERKMFHNDVFSNVNKLLRNTGDEPIEWLKPVKNETK